MKIIEFHSEAFKRLRAVDITPDGHIVEIRGKNAQGKSSVLDAIYALFASADALPKRPVRVGSDQAIIRASIGDDEVEYVVTRRISADGKTNLLVENKDGARFPSPQRLMDGFIGAISFDPLEFTREKPKAQLETLRKIVKLDVDLDALDGQNARDYEKRAEANRDATKLRGQAAGIQVSPDLPEKPHDTSALIQKLQQAGEHNAEIEREIARRRERANDVERLRQAAVAKENEAHAEFQRAARIIAGAEALESKAKNLQAEAAARLADIERLAAPEQAIDTAELAEELRAAQEVNSAIGARDRRSTIEAQADALEKRSQEFTDTMKARAQEKAAAIARAQFPVPGLSFGDGEVLLDGVPFEQASQAQKIRVSVAVAIAVNPKLRVLCVRDGSLLDRDSWKLLAELVAASDYQCWIERTTDDDDGKVGIVIEDGVVRGAPMPETEARPRKAKAKEADAPDLLAGQ